MLGGIEPCTIKDIKNYKPKSNSISNSQILFRDYDYKEARVVLNEMIDNLVLNLVSKKLYTDRIGFYIGYSKDIISPLSVNRKIDYQTNSFTKISNELLTEYDYSINQEMGIRRIGISFSNVADKKVEQLDIFNTSQKEEVEEQLENAVYDLKSKYGKNTILRAISYTDSGTQRMRNKLIGGHNAE